MSEQHCLGCHGHPYDKWSSCAECGDEEEPKCPGILRVPCPECERLRAQVDEAREALSDVNSYFSEDFEYIQSRPLFLGRVWWKDVLPNVRRAVSTIAALDVGRGDVAGDMEDLQWYQDRMKRLERQLAEAKAATVEAERDRDQWRHWRAEDTAELRGQLAEGQAHVRDHHIEACVSCAATESERDALQVEVERLKSNPAWGEVYGLRAAVERLETERDDLCTRNEKLDAEVERLAESRCTDHATAPAVDGCGVCVRERLATALSPTAGRELTAMRAALCAMLIWVDGEPYYRSSLGIPMELPSNVRRTVKLTLREIDFKPGKEPGK